MNVASYYRSLTGELEALKDRVRELITDHHWQTDGEWKESVLRTVISRHLPDTVRVGRGFVVTESVPTPQCDILLYRADCPVLFREGELVFLTPDAVLGIIEVKSSVTATTFSTAIKKLAATGALLGAHRERCHLGLFAYSSQITNAPTILEALSEHCVDFAKTVNFITLGRDLFVRFWECAPGGDKPDYRHWHAYQLECMSAGYFVANVLDAVTPSVAEQSTLWFPPTSKEITRVAKRRHPAASGALRRRRSRSNRRS